jgi:hypothetical protein
MQALQEARTCAHDLRRSRRRTEDRQEGKGDAHGDDDLTSRKKIIISDGTSSREQVEEAMSEALIRKCPKCNTPGVKEYGCNKVCYAAS